jgi:hypothetical protein
MMFLGFHTGRWQQNLISRRVTLDLTAGCPEPITSALFLDKQDDTHLSAAT